MFVYITFKFFLGKFITGNNVHSLLYILKCLSVALHFILYLKIRVNVAIAMSKRLVLTWTSSMVVFYQTQDGTSLIVNFVYFFI